MQQPVVGVPELALDEEVLSLDDAPAEELLKRLADHVLVAVVVSRVDEAVAGLQEFRVVTKLIFEIQKYF